MQVTRQQLAIDVVVDENARPVDRDELLARFLLQHVRRQRSDTTETSSTTAASTQ